VTNIDWPQLNKHVVGRAVGRTCDGGDCILRRVGECGVSDGFEQRGMWGLVAATPQSAKYCCQRFADTRRRGLNSNNFQISIK